MKASSFLPHWYRAWLSDVLWPKQCLCKRHVLLLGTSFKRHQMCYHDLCFPLPLHPQCLRGTAPSFWVLDGNPKPDPPVISHKQKVCHRCCKPSQLGGYLLGQQKLAQVHWWCVLLTNYPQTSQLKKKKVYFSLMLTHPTSGSAGGTQSIPAT